MGMDPGKYVRAANKIACEKVRGMRLIGINRSDLAQEGLLYLCQEAWRFDPSRGSEELFACAKIASGIRHAIKKEFSQKRGRLRTFAASEPGHLPGKKSSPSSRTEAAEVWKKAEAVLPRNLVPICRLVYRDGLNQIEAADRLGVTKQHVYHRLCYARKYVAEFFPNCMSEVA